MKRKFLEDMGLTKEQVDSIMAENDTDVVAAKGENDGIKQQLESMELQIKDRDKQLETLKKASGDSEALQKQIEELQAENKTAKEKYASDMKELKLAAAVKLAVANTAHDADLVAGLVDRSKLILSDDGKVSGLDEQVKALKESKAFLFKEDSVTPKPGKKPAYTPKAGETAEAGWAKTVAEDLNKEGSKNPYADAWAVK